jgi:hypothetical protein
MLKDVFLDQKIVNVCEHMVKMVQQELRISVTRMCAREVYGRSGEDGGKIEWELSEVNTRAVSREQNELMGKFKMAAGVVISIRGRLCTTPACK